MEYKKILGGGLLVLFLLSLLAIPVMAGNGNGNGNGKSNAELAQERLTELKHGNGYQYGKYKTSEETWQYSHKLIDINDEIEVYSDLDSSTIISTVENDKRIRLKDIGNEHKLRSVQILYSDIADTPGYEDDKVLISHYNDFGIKDAAWIQEVINQDGYVYIDDLPFSEIVIGGYYTAWTKEENKYRETTNDDINIGFSADPGMINFINAYVNDFNVTGSVVGFEINVTDDAPAVRTVDIDGNTLINYNYSKHPIWGNIKRCTVDTTTLDITYGTNNRGDGLDLSGASGPVMVEVPRFWVNYDNSTGNQIFWVSPYNLSDYGFEVHPAFMQGTGYESPYIYFGAFEGSPAVNDTGSLYLDSKTGVQPWTGGEIDSLAFTSGSAEFNIGDNVTGATSGAYGYVVDYYVSSGTWGSNDAAGTVYLKQVNGTYQAENLQVSVSTVAVSSGANSPISLTLDESLGYANNTDEQFTIGDAWAYSALQLLAYTEFGTRDLQTALGRGVVDLPSGVGYAGLDTGAGSINSNFDVWGTGVGSGTDGQTPTCWRGLENFASGGNVYEFISGENMMAADGSVRLINPDGTGTPAGTLADGDYIVLDEVVPLADGYIGSFQATKYGALSWTPATTDGSSSTGAGDYFLYPRYSPSIVLFGGCWNSGSSAGVSYRSASNSPSNSARTLGARLKYVPQRTENASSPSISTPNIKFITNSNSTYSTGWNDSGDNPISIPFSASDSDVTTVYTTSDVLGKLDLNVTVGYLENTTIISEELTSEFYRVYITHIPGNDYENGHVNYTSDANDILDSPFLQTNMSSNNENASYTLSTYDWSVSTGPINAGQTYNYVLTAYLEGTVIDDTDRDGIGYTGLGAYEAEGNETIVIGSKYVCYSPISGDWNGVLRGSDVYIPAASLIGVVILIIGAGYAVQSLRKFKEE